METGSAGQNLSRLRQEYVSAFHNSTIAFYIAASIAGMGALMAFAPEDGEVTWFYWALALAGATALVGVGQRTKALRLEKELDEAGYYRR